MFVIVNIVVLLYPVYQPVNAFTIRSITTNYNYPEIIIIKNDSNALFSFVDVNVTKLIFSPKIELDTFCVMNDL